MAFSYYRSVTIQSGQVPSTQTDFPVLVSITDATLKASPTGHVQSANGYDIRPYADSALSSALFYELEFYDGTNGIVVLWVKLSSISNGTVFYLAYGDATISSDGSSASTWDSHFKSVWHLKEASGATRVDSIATNNLTDNSTVTKVSAQIGDGIQTNGTSNWLSSSTISGLSSLTSTTISLWLKNLTGAGLKGFMDACDSATFRIAVGYYDNSRNGYLVANEFGSTKPSSSVTNTNWNYLVILSDGSHRPALYVNGVANDANDGAGLSAWDAIGISLGRGFDFSTLSASSQIDEVRLSDIQRSADWILAEYNNQSAPSSFYSLGAETAVGSRAVGSMFSMFR